MTPSCILHIAWPLVKEMDQITQERLNNTDKNLGCLNKIVEKKGKFYDDDWD